MSGCGSPCVCQSVSQHLLSPAALSTAVQYLQQFRLLFEFNATTRSRCRAISGSCLLQFLLVCYSSCGYEQLSGLDSCSEGCVSLHCQTRVMISLKPGLVRNTVKFQSDRFVVNLPTKLFAVSFDGEWRRAVHGHGSAGW
eukprot:3019481-Amphidinium_carterae.1